MMAPGGGGNWSAPGEAAMARPAAAAAARGRENMIAVDVEGMMCQKNCGSTVKRAIEAVPGVMRAEVSFPARRAWAWLSPADAAGTPPARSGGTNGRTGPSPGSQERILPPAVGDDGDDTAASAAVAVLAAVVEAVEAVGFGAEASPDVELLVEGMMCQKNCGTTVRNALLASTPAVVRAEASFAEGRARVWTRPRPAGGGEGGVSGVAGGGLTATAAANSSTALPENTRLMVDALGAVGFDARPAPTAVLEIEGMMCQKSCGSTVQRCLESVPGVERAEVSYALGRLAKVWAEGGARLPTSALVEAVEDVGFGARVVGPGDKKKKDAELPPGGGGSGDGSAVGSNGAVETSVPKMLLGQGGAAAAAAAVGAMSIGVFSVSGMSCASCVGNVESFVSALDGVEDVRVALLAEKAEVRFDPEVTDGQVLADGITGLGYPTRHLGTTALSGNGDGKGGVSAGTGDVTLEVLGVVGPGDVSILEAAVSGLPGVASCTVSPLPPSASFGASGGVGGSGGGYLGNHRLVYLLTARRVPVSAAAVKPLSTAASAAASPSPSLASGGGDGGDGADTGEALDGGGGGGGNPNLSRPAGTNDAVWGALQAAYDSRGRLRHSGVREVLETVRGLGYEASVVSAGGGGDTNAMEASQTAEVAAWRRLLLLAVGFTVPVMILHMNDHVNGPDKFCSGEASAGTLLSWVLVTVVQFVVGKRFYRNAYKAAKHGSFGMDMLVVVGTSVSYLYSTLALLLACTLPGEQGDRPHLFLESPAMLLTFIALGKFLEVMAKRKTSQALVFLLQAQPHGALLVEPRAEDGDDDGERGQEWAAIRAKGWRERSVEASLVQPGDVLRVLPGSQFPTDGTLLSGHTYVDESMITGESSPVAKREGDPVCGGTANQHGSVLMRAERVGEDTMLAQLCRLVEEAQMSKAPIQRQADRVAGVFVPAVIFASLATFLGWFIAGEAGFVPQDWLAEERSDAFLFALLFGVSVVVVACPCALGLATPTAVMVGTGVGAGNGVLIKGGAALEAAHRVNTVVFDKTGTLTNGKPFLTDVVPVPSPALDRLVAASPAAAAGGAAVLAIAAACEAYSEHPVGRAMVDAAASQAATAAAIQSANAVAAATSAAAGGGSMQQQQKQRKQRGDPPLSTLPEETGTGQGDDAPAGTGGPGAAAGATTDFVSEPGCGVACQHPVGRVCVGTRAWAETNGGKRKVVVGGGGGGGGGGARDSSLEAADGIMRGLEEEGKTAVMVTVDGEAVGVVAVADTDKEGSRRAVLALGRMGLDVWVVTGDNRRVAAALARRLGIAPNRVMSEVLPAEKARKVQELQLAGGHVAMVGDGVNDAPALATADVGIAVGAGTQVAMEAADMVLVRSDVCDVVAALHLGRKVFGRIRLNFVFAMLYNLCGVPVAAGVLYPFLHIRLPPALAGLSMALSSISVVLSSLALRLYKKPEIDQEGRLRERRAAAAVLEAAYEFSEGMQRFALWRRLSRLLAGGAMRFGVVGDDDGGYQYGFGGDDVERQPLGRQASTDSSGSSAADGRWTTPAARHNGSSIADSFVGAEATGTAGSFALVQAHGTRSSGNGVGPEEARGVEMIGFV